MSGWPYIKARRTAESLEKQREYAYEKALSGINTRVTSKLLREILLHHGDSGFWKGELRFMNKRSLGCGIYEIWFKAKNDI